MATVRKNHRSDGEYIRDLIRRDRERCAEFAALKAAVREGLDSGPSAKIFQSIHLALGEDLRLTDAYGYELLVRIVDIAGRSALVEYRAAPNS